MKTLMTLMVLAICAGQAFATAVNSGGGKKSVARMNDSSGYPIQFNDDKPWKVFEVKDTSTAAQLVDESSVAPKQGMVKRVCLESAAAIPAASDSVVFWDTVTAADIATSGAGRRIMPPVMRVSGVEKCLEVNALFTSGLGIKQGASVGSTYVYWRELGGYR